MAELDRLVCRFTTLNDFHLRMYGLEDEYEPDELDEVLDDDNVITSTDTAAIVREKRP